MTAKPSLTHRASFNTELLFQPGGEGIGGQLLSGERFEQGANVVGEDFGWFDDFAATFAGFDCQWRIGGKFAEV